MNENRNAFTKQLLISSGIKKHMRVLDTGCGTGEVSILLNEIMEGTGEVVGIDISKSAVNSARTIIENKKISNIRFIAGKIESLPENLKYFDAVVGRRILMYLPDPLRTIRFLKEYLKPEGLMIFQESEVGGSGMGTDKLPKHTQVQSWVRETIIREGGNVHIGSEMYALFTKAGLNIKDIKAEVVLQTPETKNDLAQLIRIMMPRIIQTGTAAKDEIDIDNLEKVLNEEIVNSKAVFMRDINFGICAVNS